MILPTMNKFEINRKIINAMSHYDNKVKNDKKAFFKRHKNMSRDAWKCEIVEWRKEKEKYIAHYTKKYGVIGCDFKALVEHGKNVWAYHWLPDIFDSMDAYSMHFYKRYAERTHKPFLWPSIVGDYENANMHRFKVYTSEDGTRSAYACYEGIELTRFDKERGITKYCTFISRSMLGPSQLEAWEVVQHKLDEAEHISRMNTSAMEKMMLLTEWSNSSPDVFELASSIYSQYYHETEEEE